MTDPVPTPRYRRVIQASEDVARSMSLSHVGVDHLFLAMIRDRHAVPTQVLQRFADLDAVEAALLELMNSDGYHKGTSRVIGEPPRPGTE